MNHLEALAEGFHLGTPRDEATPARRLQGLVSGSRVDDATGGLPNLIR